MVNNINERAALAVLSRAAATQSGDRKTPAPQALPISQQESRHQALLLRLDRPRLDNSLFAVIEAVRGQDAAHTRPADPVGQPAKPASSVTTAPIAAATAGTASAPAMAETTTPSAATITTSPSLSGAALQQLQTLSALYNRLAQSSGGRSDDRDSELVRALSNDLQGFAARIGNSRGDQILGDIIGRIEASVIGQGGLEFTDFRRDPALFQNIAAGLSEFADSTNSSAARALRDVIIRVGDRRLTDDNPNNDNLRPLGAAIDRLARVLDEEPEAAAALQDFLHRLPAPPDPLRDFRSYAGQIAGLLDDTLADINAGEDAATRLQATITAIQTLTDAPHQADDWLRNGAIQDLQQILDGVMQAGTIASGTTDALASRVVQAYRGAQSQAAASSSDLYV